MAQQPSPLASPADASNETPQASDTVSNTDLPSLECPADTLEDQAARAETLERLALYHAQCEDAASACWYLCRSLGLARQQEPGEPTLELLFELLGALADLPSEVSAAPLPESETASDTLGIFELCHQLASAREQTQAAWAEIDAMVQEEEAALDDIASEPPQDSPPPLLH